MPNTTLKKYQDYANSQVDEQAILDKYNAATVAQYNAQREQLRQSENQFYNQMYNTQRTAMDTIRQNNAAAVSTGASRGVQAAQELSALLGLQQESVAGATEVAQAQRQTAQEETAAVLENVLKAYQQAATERSQLVQQGIEAASVDVQAEANRQQEISTLTSARAQAKADGDYAAVAVYTKRLQELGVISAPSAGAGTNPVPGTYDPATNMYTDGSVQYDTFGTVLKSGVDANGNMHFTTADLKEENIQNVYNVLAQIGFDSGAREIFDIADPEQRDEIKQTNYDGDKQKGKPARYIDAMKADAEAGKIPVGSIVQLNYGGKMVFGKKNYTYIYLGGTHFAKVNLQAIDFDDNGLLNGRAVYVPAGYTIKNKEHGSGDWIKPVED